MKAEIIEDHLQGAQAGPVCIIGAVFFLGRLVDRHIVVLWQLSLSSGAFTGLLPGLGVLACDSGTQEIEAGGWPIPNHPKTLSQNKKYKKGQGCSSGAVLHCLTYARPG